jgi:hypothetical protein
VVATLAAVAAVALLGALAFTVVGDDEQRATRPTAPRADHGSRAAAAAAMLAELTAAVTAADRRALRTLADPDAPTAREELDALADNVRALRMAEVRMRYRGDSRAALPPARQAALGGRTWVADVEVTWRVTGEGSAASVLVVPVALDFEGARAVFSSARVTESRRTPLWLLDRVAVRRTPRVVVVAAAPVDPRRLVRQGERAVAAVRRMLPRWRRPLVIEVPATSTQFLAASGLDADSGGTLAAVTTTPDGSGLPGRPAHVYLHREQFARLGPVGRQVVLTHEATHVALGSATSRVPAWLSEGIADYIALARASVPVAKSAAQVRRLVRAEGPPRALPSAAQLDGSDPDAGAWYEAAWYAVRQLADTYGEPAVLAFYRVAERDRGTVRAFREVLGTTEQAFVERWRTALQALAR